MTLQKTGSFDDYMVDRADQIEARRKAYYQKNKERLLIYSRAWKAYHKGKRCPLCGAWNPQHRRERAESPQVVFACVKCNRVLW